MYKQIFYCMLVVIFTAAISSCAKDGEDGKPGADGKPGTVVTIGTDGYWYLDGVKTNYRASGTINVPSIGEDGYWYIDGVKTNYKADGSKITIGADGYWYIDGLKTDYKAVDDNLFTLTFDADNGSPLKTQTVIKGAWANEPKDPVKSIAMEAITVSGLYATKAGMVNYIFDGWFLENATTPFDFDTPITGSITLTAKWTLPVINLTSAEGATIFDKAISYVNINPATYALMLDNDVSVAGSTTRTLSAASKLTIIGIGAERKISLTSQGHILTVGGVQATELTLGNNITLVGLINNNQSLLRVASNLIMLEGSKITGNTTISSVNIDASAAVYITSSTFPPTFTMKGGVITGNKTESTDNRAAGMFVRYSSQNPVISLEGGSITGNEGKAGDVLMEKIALTFSGTAQVGTLTLIADMGGPTSVKIASGWTGDNVLLNLYGASIDIAGVIIPLLWDGKTILQGDAVNATTVSKFQLGNFINDQNPPSTQPITNTHHISDTGVLTANVP